MIFTSIIVDNAKFYKRRDLCNIQESSLKFASCFFKFSTTAKSLKMHCPYGILVTLHFCFITFKRKWQKMTAVYILATIYIFIDFP